MTREHMLDKLLEAYSSYYNINRDSAAEPFLAEAIFQMHDEKYLLVKSAKVSESDSGDIIFFSEAGELTADTVRTLSKRAWEEGVSRVKPDANHKNTDINLYILSDSLTPEAVREVKKTKFYKSYKFSIHGYSHFKVIAYDLANDQFVHNRMGGHLAKVVSNIFKDMGLKKL